ncbi:hypothetical protein VTN49DRAFT_3349 [Thermomyces lanuginosus]|uniref:uncharacterized protein n=1 Tax=Thermomyces lanuginosus TaxID=5541 RepID=UPI003742AC31
MTPPPSGPISSHLHLPPLSIFPSFLFRVPFRHHKSKSSTATATNTSNQNNNNNNNNFPLTSHSSFIRCARCAAHICFTSQIISKGFTGRHGRAYLVSADPVSPTAPSPTVTAPQNTSLPNTLTQRAVSRQLVTGAHTVCDISCVFCGSVLGWKYLAAEDESQRYKVGKFILERKKIDVASCWGEGDFGSGSGEDWLDDDGLEGNYSYPAGPGGDHHQIEFDSQDEDECEDLFAGVWSPARAEMKRRKSRKL